MKRTLGPRREPLPAGCVLDAQRLGRRTARFYAIDSKGTLLGSFALTGCDRDRLGGPSPSAAGPNPGPGLSLHRRHRRQRNAGTGDRRRSTSSASRSRNVARIAPARGPTSRSSDVETFPLQLSRTAAGRRSRCSSTRSRRGPARPQVVLRHGRPSSIAAPLATTGVAVDARAGRTAPARARRAGHGR